MSRDLVSVIIPTYNREKTIYDSIGSVLNQTYTNLECIVIDDCSIDNTQEIVMTITDRRLKYIKCDHNVGPSKARNVGIDVSAGDYITFNDSDSYWNQEKLEKQMNYFWKNPECGMVYCRFMYRTPKSDRILPASIYERTELEGYIYEKLLWGNLVDTSAMLIKKEVINKIGKFSEQIKSLEDYELALRIAYEYNIGFVDEVLYENVYSSNSVNLDKNNKIDALIYLLRQNWNKTKSVNKYAMFISFLKLVASLHNYEEQNQIMEKLYMEMNLSHQDKEIVRLMLNILSTELFKKEFLKKDLFTSKVLDKWKNTNILLYGYGEIGKILLSQFEGAGIQIKGFIDQNIICDKKYKVFLLKEVPENIDLIINTLPECQMQNKEIEKHTSAKVISIMEIF